MKGNAFLKKKHGYLLSCKHLTFFRKQIMVKRKFIVFTYIHLFKHSVNPCQIRSFHFPIPHHIVKHGSLTNFGSSMNEEWNVARSCIAPRLKQ